jgi:small subunit ribosomal protein S8
MVSDPIGDFIIRLKNAAAVKKDRVVIPYSKLKYAIAGKLQERGYVKEVARRGKKARKHLDIELAYNKSDAVLHGVKRVSKPGRRMYTSSVHIRPVRYGKGTLILSTPKGILTGEEARKGHVGGEMLFEVW